MASETGQSALRIFLAIDDFECPGPSLAPGLVPVPGPGTSLVLALALALLLIFFTLIPTLNPQPQTTSTCDLQFLFDEILKFKPWLS